MGKSTIFQTNPYHNHMMGSKIPADVRGDLAPLSGSAAGSRLEEEKEVCQGMERVDRI